MSSTPINTDPHHIASLVYQVWTQEEEKSQPELQELRALRGFYQESGCDGGIALDGTCDDTDLPRGSTCAQAVSSFLAFIEQQVQG